LVTAPPDLLVTGDGRHVAVRTTDGRIALLRPKAGDYIRDVMGEASGTQEDALDFDHLDTSRCGRDICVTAMEGDDRTWRILATRSPYLIDIKQMNRACAEADIAISDRRLPRSCHTRWLKLDRPALAQTGGLAIRLGSDVESVADAVGQHPWAMRMRAERPSRKPNPSS
jgi:competence protein ComEC